MLLVSMANNTSRLIALWGGNTMLLFIFHPYTNNVASIFVEKIGYGDWSLKLLLSLVMLQIIVCLKDMYSHWKLFKYV